MSTTIGTVSSEGMRNHTVEVYIGVHHVVLFIQNDSDREGKGTKILLDKDKWNDLQDFLFIAGQEKGWTKDA